MKKYALLSVMALASLGMQAQNVQLHYDLGRHLYSDGEAGRQAFTATFEQFKADKTGSWFYFIDLDVDKKGMAGAYTEITREFTFSTPSPSGSFAAHIEYNGGLNRGGSFQTAGLLGVAWNGHNADFSKTYSIQTLYKQFFGQNGNKAYASAQLTGVWSTTFAQGKCTFAGFIDFWRGEKGNGHGQLVILSEPQLWYNVNDKISLGTEWELSNNFIYNPVNDKSFFVNPTIAVKFNL